MAAPEIAHRVVRAGRTTLERALLPTGWQLKPRGELPPHAVRALSPAWFSLQPGVAADAYRSAAERILAGRMEVFCRDDLDLGFPPRWNREPTSDIDIPLSFGKSLDYRNPRRVGDVKFVWEINRHSQLVTLAQAWHLAGDARYLEACRELLDSWLDQCPYPLGINWSCSLEPAIRLVNWSAAWHLMGGERCPLFQQPGGASFRARWMTSIWQHCSFIAGHLSRFSSANNHLLGELLGLYAGACTWPLWPESARWRDAGRHGFEHEALRQNFTDGVNREQAVYYHHFVLQMMIFAGVMSRAYGRPFAPPFWARTERMLEYLASVMDAGGHTPSLGDEDGAVVVRFAPEGIPDVYRSLLGLGAVLFNRPDFRHKAGDFDEQCRWVLGQQGAEHFGEIHPDSSNLPPRKAFTRGGLYVLGDCFETPQEIRVLFDAAPLGYLGIAAHGHADALSLTLSIGGEPVLIDPGTFGYYIDRKWRDYFRGTSAHNTIRVDGEDQSVSGGPFLWTRHARAWCKHYVSTPGLDRITAAHDGYQRLRDPVLHHRQVDVDKVRRLVIIRDDIVCSGIHQVECFWHIPRERLLALDDHQAMVRTTRHVLKLELPQDCRIRLVQGSQNPLLGWRSMRFGDLRPCHTLVATRQICGPWRGVTRIAIQ